MIRVMIVEDQKLVRSLLESYIQNEDGYQLAVSIPSAAEAPILCDTEDIDVVLMDVQTEHRENGLAAAKKIHTARADKRLSVDQRFAFLINGTAREQLRFDHSLRCGNDAKILHNPRSDTKIHP